MAEIIFKEGYVLLSLKSPEINPAQKAARRMEKLIHDQIDESNGSI